MTQCSALARRKAGTASCVFALLYLVCIFMRILVWVMYIVYVYWRVRYEFWNYGKAASLQGLRHLRSLLPEKGAGAFRAGQGCYRKSWWLNSRRRACQASFQQGQDHRSTAAGYRWPLPFNFPVCRLIILFAFHFFNILSKYTQSPIRRRRNCCKAGGVFLFCVMLCHFASCYVILCHFVLLYVILLKFPLFSTAATRYFMKKISA